MKSYNITYNELAKVLGKLNSDALTSAREISGQEILDRDPLAGGDDPDDLNDKIVIEIAFSKDELELLRK